MKSYSSGRTHFPSQWQARLDELNLKAHRHNIIVWEGERGGTVLCFVISRNSSENEQLLRTIPKVFFAQNRSTCGGAFSGSYGGEYAARRHVMSGVIPGEKVHCAPPPLQHPHNDVHAVHQISLKFRSLLTLPGNFPFPWNMHSA